MNDGRGRGLVRGPTGVRHRAAVLRRMATTRICRRPTVLGHMAAAGSFRRRPGVRRPVGPTGVFHWWCAVGRGRAALVDFMPQLLHKIFQLATAGRVQATMAEVVLRPLERGVCALHAWVAAVGCRRTLLIGRWRAVQGRSVV